MLQSNNWNKPTCLESDKIPGKYQVNITPCLSTTIHGAETETLFSGGYCRCRDFSFLIDTTVPGFEYLCGSFSA